MRDGIPIAAVRLLLLPVACLLLLAPAAGGQESSASALAEQILGTEGLRPGLCVHVGCGDGTLAAELARTGKYVVHGLTADREELVGARANIRSLGLYGRATASHCPLDVLPYADDMVNLLVVNDFPSAEKDRLSREEVIRVLAPDGMAVLVVNGRLERLVKRRADGAGEWTHFEHDAGRTSVSEDRLVGVASGVRWMAGVDWPAHLYGHRSDVGFASAQGRNFYWYTEPDDAGSSRLMCRDAYNGLLAWEKRVEGAARTGGLVAVGGRVFLHPGDSGGLRALDAATGEETLAFGESGPDGRPEVLYLDGVLVERAGGAVRAFDAAEGTVLWEKPNAFTGGDAVLLSERRAFYLQREGEGAPVHLVCDVLATGEERWRRDVTTFGSPDAPGLICCRDGIVLLGSWPRQIVLLSGMDPSCAVYAVSAADGELLWRHEFDATHHFGRATNALFLDDLVWLKESGGSGKDILWVGLDPQTGAGRRSFSGPYNRCYPDRASATHILTGDLDFLDPATGTLTGIKASRGACNVGFMPANGMIYTLYLRCGCYNFLRGLMAFSSEPAPAAEADVPPPASRLERGPAYGTAVGALGSPDNWPTLRHDHVRSGSTPARPPARLDVLWTARAGADASAPVAARGRLFVAATDEHRVLCLDAASGQLLWDYVAGGRVDSPPTVCGGLVIFGSADGRAYCLRAADGALVWRFRAAPRDRRIVARGQVESLWPVHGSVLALDDTVYFAAGRHSQVDGGIHCYALDAATGAVRWQRRFGEEVRDNLNHVLVSDGGSLHLGQRVHLDPATGDAPRRGSDRAVLFAQWGLLADNTAPGATSAGMSFHTRPWSRTSVRTVVEPRGISWNQPLKGNLLVFDGDAVFGVLETFRNKPRRRAWDAFGLPSGVTENWTVALDEDSREPKALVLVGRALFLALQGAGGEGGEVRALASADGREMGRGGLPFAPRWDGMAATGGRLFVCGQDGRVVCMGE